MATNATNTATQSARNPRGIVQINGTAVSAWTRFEIDSNSYGSADTFRVMLVASALPVATDKNWFSQQTDMYVELFCGFPADPDSYTAAELTSLIYGQVDDIAFDPVAGTMELSGRDLTRIFIDTKSTQKWVNLKSSEIAIALAESHGMNYVVTLTDTKVGRYYDVDHTNMADARSEWDVLCTLAAYEGFLVYVRGKTLYFGAPPSDTATPYVVTWSDGINGTAASANVEDLQCTRSLVVSRGIQVLIRSWNARQQKGFSVQYPPGTSTATAATAGAYNDVQVYSKIVPNLSQQQAAQMAESWYGQLIKHEMKITFSLPADLDLDTTSVIQLKGTGTAYDQLYYPDSITWELSFDGGFTMHVSAKNHAPASGSGSEAGAT